MRVFTLKVLELTFGSMITSREGRREIGARECLRRTRTSSQLLGGTPEKRSAVIWHSIYELTDDLPPRLLALISEIGGKPKTSAQGSPADKPVGSASILIST